MKFCYLDLPASASILKTARELAMPVGSARVSIRHGDSYIDTGGGKTISELP
jgi:hypothetical protein